MDISGATALVTGANRGLGKAFVEVLMKRGVKHVYAGARDPSSLTPLTQTFGQQVIPLSLDVTNDVDISNAAKIASDATLVINNAGVLAQQGLMQADSLEPLQRELDVNLFGIARMCLAFSPVLKETGGGAFVNVLSVASLHGFAPFGTYCVSKAAAMSLTQSLRYELRDQGTAVHGVYAGFIETDMTADIEGEMVPPESIVNASLDGVENGILDINADERSVAVRTLLREEDHDTIQSAYFDRADEFYDAHGKP